MCQSSTDLPPTYWDVLACVFFSIFKRCGLWDQAPPHHAPRQKGWIGAAMCGFTLPAGDELFSGCMLMHHQDAIISFFPSANPVCPHSSGGEAIVGWQLKELPFSPFSSPVLSSSLFIHSLRVNGWRAERQIGGESHVGRWGLPTNANSRDCVFTIHTGCPQSNQIAYQLTASSGVECKQGEGEGEREKGRGRGGEVGMFWRQRLMLAVVFVVCVCVCVCACVCVSVCVWLVYGLLNWSNAAYEAGASVWSENLNEIKS